MEDIGNLASHIDHTNLKPTATSKDIGKLCEEAKEHCFFSVCVNSNWVPLAKELLASTPVVVCCVVGFPMGATHPKLKAQEAEEAVKLGAREIDMVMNIGAFLEGDHELVKKDIAGAVRSVRATGGTCVKVIIETGYLAKDEITLASSLVKQAGADFVKTSTGFGPKGAEIEDIRIMRTAVGPDFGVKAAGGIKTKEFAQGCIKAGATRLGTSSGVAIIRG